MNRNVPVAVLQVTGTFLLLLEDQVSNPKTVRPAQRLRIPAVRIPLAGFLLGIFCLDCHLIL